MNISNPRRILALGGPSSGVLALLKDLTGCSPPLPTDGGIAGLSHSFSISTAYYKATIPIWIDEITDPQAWSAEFLKPEAKEVLNVLGAFLFCFPKPIDQNALERVKETLRAIQTVVTKGCGYGWDGICLAIAMPQSVTPHLQLESEEWDDICMEMGFEYVDAEAKGRNQFGESTGIARVKEALEANDWAANDEEFSEEALLGGEEPDEGFGAEAAELEREMFGMKTVIQRGSAEEGKHGDDADDGDDEFEVEQLETMMLKMTAVRDMSAGMPEEERKKFAAKAVNDIMKMI
ncbi:MAG: hypothetical protein M1836_003815 [Candelina mexicana]|nr:MAG: hypothetical protein M1836_003815 [Candelina mexicana]